MSTPSSPWEWTSTIGGTGFCVTFTHGKTPHEVLACYGADPGRAALHTLYESADKYEETSEGTLLRTGPLGRWTFCYEDGVPEGIKTQVLHRLSQGTDTLALFKGGDGLVTFTHFHDGNRAAQFEPGRPHTIDGDDPQHFWQAIQIARQPADNNGRPVLSIHAALHAIGQHIGADFDTSTLNGSMLTALLPDTDRVPRDITTSQPSNGPSRRSLGRAIQADTQ
ncbi:DUF6461 domain-containing protein [Streptomyces sp. NBRC 110028]|uniref:DUF6461 domain-containing protein n=1 Tax=Streptomyces sp. NBRC 110028 TaxID=1621260 RepID=UPI000AEFB657|nr:DUF6461 domain-containing protein [Streptomyces sp. NBRC 110028]